MVIKYSVKICEINTSIWQKINKVLRLVIITINANHQSDGTDCQSVHYGLRVRSLRNYDGLRKTFLL